MRPETKKWLQLLEHGMPREQWQAGKQLAHSTDQFEAALAVMLNHAQDDALCLRILRIFRNRGAKQPATVDAIMRKVSMRNDLLRQGAIAALLHGSPKLRRHAPRLKALAAHETSPSIQQMLIKILARYPNA